MPWNELKTNLDTLQSAIDHNDKKTVLELLKQLVDGYQPNGEIVDWVYSEQAVSNL